MTIRHEKVKTTPNQPSYSKYTFRERGVHRGSVGLWRCSRTGDSIRHSASVSPWVDRDIHLHSDSEEYYFLFQGELQLLVDGSVFTLKPCEVLMVKPQVPHAVVGGNGTIEHFVVRMPAPDDRQTTGKVLPVLPPVRDEAKRELLFDWGCRVPLTEARHQNCWLFGVGQARFHSDYMCLAYLSFPTDESVNADRQSYRHCLHLHKESCEYYTVLRGGAQGYFRLRRSLWKSTKGKSWRCHRESSMCCTLHTLLLKGSPFEFHG